MTHTRRLLPRSATLLLLLGTQVGCLASNRLTTARPNAEGQWSFEGAPAAFAYSDSDSDGLRYGPGVTMGGRLGLLDRADLGVGLSTLGLGIDSRIRLTDGFADGWVDVAVVPGAYVGALSLVDDTSGLQTVVGAHVLAAVSVGPADGVSAHLFGGPELAYVDGVTATLARYGGGVRVWFGEHFALHPEVTVVSDVEVDFTLVDLAIGLGFVVR